MRSKLFLFIVFLLVEIIMAGRGYPQIKTPTSLRVGDFGVASNAAIYVGVEKGFFNERGIEIKFLRFASGAAMMAPLATGEIKVASGGMSIGLFNALARGMPIKLVAAQTRQVPGYSVAVISVRGDLKEKIKGAADIKGKKVAMPAPGTAGIYMLGKALEDEGLTLKDVEIVYMPFPDMGVAFSNKAIDAGLVAEPFPTMFQDKGWAIIWKRVGEYIRNPYMETSLVFYNKDWAEKNSQVARDFMVAYLKAARYYYEAMVGGGNRAEVVDILVKYTAVKDKAIYAKMEWNFTDPNGTILKENLKDQQEFYFKNGMVPKKADVDTHVDDSYVKYALEQLGPYPRK